MHCQKGLTAFEQNHFLLTTCKALEVPMGVLLSFVNTTGDFFVAVVNVFQPLRIQ